MLGGLDPIIIFNLKKRPPAATGESSIPIVSDVVNLISLPAIPVYLSEKLTGILIDAEEKSIEVHTETNTLTDGSAPEMNQRAIQSVVNITMKAKQSSIGATLLGALSDLIFPKLTSKEYSITYLHGAVTVFDGLLNSFSMIPNTDDDLYIIQLSLIKPAPDTSKKVVEVPKITSALPVGAPAI